MQIRTFAVGDTELPVVTEALESVAAGCDAWATMIHTTDAEREECQRRALILRSVRRQIADPQPQESTNDPGR